MQKMFYTQLIQHAHCQFCADLEQARRENRTLHVICWVPIPSVNPTVNNRMLPLGHLA